MKYSAATRGRTFVVRLEDGDVVHAEVERLARAEGIRAAAVIAVGGADAGSRLVVGPEDGRASPVVPVEHVLENVHEAAGVGTIFPDECGNPTLHLHAACGRQDRTVTGCVRRGMRVWHVLELVVIELTDTRAMRVPDPATGFRLLQP